MFFPMLHVFKTPILDADGAKISSASTTKYLRFMYT